MPPTVDRKLHSIALIMDGSSFSGPFDVGQQAFQCKFKPASASIENGKLVLTGTLDLTGRDRRLRRQASVRATLAAIQGAVNGRAIPPVEFATRPQPPQQQPATPSTEFTNDEAFAGVMYLHVASLKAPVLGIPLDLTKVQLNCRLYPDSDLEREIHWLYSSIATSLLTEPKDEAAAAKLVEPLVARFKR